MWIFAIVSKIFFPSQFFSKMARERSTFRFLHSCFSTHTISYFNPRRILGTKLLVFPKDAYSTAPPMEQCGHSYSIYIHSFFCTLMKIHSYGTVRFSSDKSVIISLRSFFLVVSVTESTTTGFKLPAGDSAMIRNFNCRKPYITNLWISNMAVCVAVIAKEVSIRRQLCNLPWK